MRLDCAARRLVMRYPSGGEWSQASRSTNAIGTARIERQALRVLGGEYYREMLNRKFPARH
jgi:transcriptional regulator of acetoin/glycerol metabolism